MDTFSWYAVDNGNSEKKNKSVPLCNLSNLQLRFLCPSDLEEVPNIVFCTKRVALNVLSKLACIIHKKLTMVSSAFYQSFLSNLSITDKILRLFRKLVNLFI